jgi:hypothetical protein
LARVHHRADDAVSAAVQHLADRRLDAEGSQNQATITTVTSSPIDLSNVFNAVAGSAEIVTNGVNTASNNPPAVGDPLGVNPRSDTGISQRADPRRHVRRGGRLSKDRE